MVPKVLGMQLINSVLGAEQAKLQGHDVILAIKQGHAHFPKKALSTVMKDFPGGTWLTMECTSPATEVKLQALAHKHSQRSIIYFVMMEGTWDTTPSNEPYVAMFKDKSGNNQQCDIPRPAAAAQHFKNPNKTFLALERHWDMKDSFFWYVTSMLETTVLDAWRLFWSPFQDSPPCQ